MVGAAKSVAVGGASDGTRKSRHAVLAATEVDIRNAEAVDIARRVTRLRSEK